MKKILFILSLIFIILEISAQNYPFDSIPDNLKKGADVVVRTGQCLYTIIETDHAIKKVKFAVTLLNDNVESYRFQTVGYATFSKVNYLRGRAYDSKGDVIKALGPADVNDMSAISGGTFYADDRMKVLVFPKYKYPYTIEVEYEVEYTSILDYPTWLFQSSAAMSVERSGIQFAVPKEMKFRYSETNLKNVLDSFIPGDLRIYTWQEENIPAIVKAKYLFNARLNLPQIQAAPLYFEYGGYKGSMESWKTFGDWKYSLIKGLDVLLPAEISKVTEIISATNDTRQRVKLIYEYVQSKTRYVAIKIGIGGYKPADAISVSKNGFGDCKALVNYTMALLKAAGIKSFYANLLAGEDGQINKNFVSQQFNHIILCVPMIQDTVWLECTSQTLPFNYLGSFTDDRYALLITSDGGKMVKTPSFTKNENITKRTGSVSFNLAGSAIGKFSNYYSGYMFGFANQLFYAKSDDELKRYLYSKLRYYDFDASTVSYTENKSEKPYSTFSYGISVKDLTTTMGSRIYFTPAIGKADYIQDVPSDMEVVRSEIISDSISYSIPQGYKIQFLPANVTLETEFGVFRYQLEPVSDRIIYKRYLELTKSKIPITKFQEVRSFVNTIAKTDNEKIILTKVI